MSSDIFSRKFDYSKFDLFYAGAQKIWASGTTLVIIEALLVKFLENNSINFEYSSN